MGKHKTRAPLFPKRPKGYNAIAKAIGEYVKFVREGRGLKIEQAARQLGIEPGHLVYLESGFIVPNTPLTWRLREWLFRASTFEKHEKLKPRKELIADGWKAYTFHMPPDRQRQFAAERERLGVTVSEFAQIAVERLLDDEPALAIISDTIERLERARVTAIVKARPELMEILQSDVELAVKMGARHKPAKWDFKDRQKAFFAENLAEEAKKALVREELAELDSKLGLQKRIGKPAPIDEDEFLDGWEIL